MMRIVPRKCEVVLSCCHSVTKETYQWERIGKVLGNSLIIPIDFCIAYVMFNRITWWTGQ